MASVPAWARPLVVATKGQKSRSGGFHKVGFEGGQMPLQRRLPKRGFKSLTNHRNVQIRLSEINLLPVDDIDLQVLKQSGLVLQLALSAKVILSGEITRKVRSRALVPPRVPRPRSKLPVAASPSNRHDRVI